VKVFLSQPPSVRARPRQRGVTLLELFVVIAVGAVIASIAIPAYQRAVLKAKVSTAVSDILRISLQVQRYSTVNNTLPATLADINMDTLLDPWGHPYRYLSFTGLKGKGKMRKDKNLVPINTQFDLYSMGADGQSVPPLTAAASRDDIVMANDGAYVGLAADY
jgi:general secretion pathway protein G